MTLPVWYFARQGLYCAFQEVCSGVGGNICNASNNDNWEELHFLQHLNHGLFWVKKAARAMSCGVYCVLDTLDSLVFEDSGSWSKPKQSRKKERTFAVWLKSTITPQIVFTLAFGDIQRDKVIWPGLDFWPPARICPLTSCMHDALTGLCCLWARFLSFCISFLHSLEYKSLASNLFLDYNPLQFYWITHFSFLTLLTFGNSSQI